MKKRLLSILLTACLLVGLLPTVVLAADGDVDYLYCNENGANWRTGTKAAGEYTVVTSSDTGWGTSGSTTWYVVNSDVTIGTSDVPQRVTVSGDVHLILTDGCTLTVNGGIQVTHDNSLTIYAQSTGTNMGSLTVQNVVFRNAGIGGGDGVYSGKDITINGGYVTATGGGEGSADIGGAGIGGGDGSGSGNNITINGGTVKAASTNGAGIGGGHGGSGDYITINGGTVKATSTNGAGIGGGGGIGSGNNITINGGYVEATGGVAGGAGIGGGGGSGSGNNITINGGYVKASGTSGPGIGGGAGRGGDSITICGGTVEATSTNGAGIGGGGSFGSTFQTSKTGEAGGNAVVFASSISDKSSQSSWSGIIFEGDADGKVYGTSVTPIEDFTIDSGKTLLIPENSELTIANITAVNSGSVYVDGTVSGLGGDLYYPLTVNGGTASTTYFYIGKTYGKAGETITLTGTNIPEGQVVDSWTTSDSAVTVENNVFTMPAKALTVMASVKTVGSVTITGDPGKTYDGEPVSMDGKYTVTGDGDVTVEFRKTGADDSTYTTTAPTDAGSYTVRISVAASDNYTAAFATRDFTITKAAQTAPDVPTVKSKTYNSVELEQIPDNANGAKAQYSMDGGATWQDSPEFTDLTPSTAYNFVARYRETDNYFASPVSTELSVTTSTTPSSGGSSTPTYPPTVTQPENGTVTVSPKSPRKGVTVTITPTPDAGYTVEQVLVTDKNGDHVKVINNGDGTYSFTQPAGKVNINVTFMEDNSMLNFFVDVFPGDYYYDAVLWAAENGITGGVDDTHFAPNAPCTRAQIVTFLWRAAGSPEPENMSSFEDVSADAYYAKAVAWAVENGITTGTGDGTTFSPNATCTRAQAMTFIYRSEQAQGGGMQGAWMFQNPFSDVDLENYYGEAVMWAVASGVTKGTSDTTFSPNNDCTRAQIVTFLYRCLGGE